MSNGIKYTSEIEQFIVTNQKGISRQQLADLLIAKFGKPFTPSGVKSYCYRKHLPNGLLTQYVKGQPPASKGITGYFKNRRGFTPSRGSFPTGNKPYNEQPIGYEYVSSSGYVVVKIGQRKYKHKHRIVWENHNGALPKGHCIKFIDNDPTNCDISNLMCVPKGIMPTLAKQSMTHNREVNTAIILTEQIKHVVRRKEAKCVNPSSKVI